MSADRWQDIEALFYEALDQPLAARDDFLAAGCGSDTELRDEVVALLSAHEDTDSIDQAMAAAVQAAAAELDEPLPTRRIGPYRLVREIGRGGLGTVYLAERDDEQYRMRVALKLVRKGLDTADILERLRLERQILAGLQHPNITRLFDGGSTEEGQPYLVMEYVEGEQIDAYCDRRRLPVAARLELAIGVCAAVAEAHRNLVIHRDLKPSNILVSTDGTPKLLDFGIAKLLEGSSVTDGLDTSEPTIAGARLLTPGYASPEQVEGHPLTTASDVYSLGVVLYRLLAGRPPFDPRRIHRAEDTLARASDAAYRAGMGDEPSPLDLARRRGTGPRRLRQRLRGDLDNILSKALGHAPEERYRSVVELAQDLRNHLDQRPVQARPASLALRTRKLLRRNRLATATIFLVGASLLAGIAATSRQAQIAQQARHAAERNLTRAETVTDFLVDLFAAPSPENSMGKELTAQQILDRGTARIDDELADEPRAQATLLHTMAFAYQGLGRFDEARELHQRGLAARQALLGDQHLDVAASLNALADLEIESGNQAPAASLLQDALAIRRAQLAADHPILAETYNDLGALLYQTGDLDGAERDLQQALAIRRQHLGELHSDTARSLNNLAAVCYARGDLAEADSLFRRVAEIWRALEGDRHPETLRALANRAAVLQVAGDLDGAEPLHREILTVRRELLGDLHPDVATSRNNLARILAQRKHYPEAISHYRAALMAFRQTQVADDPRIAQTLNNLGEALHRSGDRTEAEQVFSAALEIHRGRSTPNRPETARTLAALGMLHLESGAPANAVRLLREAVAIRHRVHPTGHWRTALAQSELAAGLLALDERNEATTLLTAAHGVLADRFGESHERTRGVRVWLDQARSEE